MKDSQKRKKKESNTPRPAAGGGGGIFSTDLLSFLEPSDVFRIFAITIVR